MLDLWVTQPDLVSEADALRLYLPLLSPAEAAQHARFRFARDRHTCLVSRALVRTVLSRYADVAPETWLFETNPYGRPFVAPTMGPVASLQFNLSHTHGAIALLVGRSGEIGVDVEYTARRGRTVAIANRFFSPTETRALMSLPESARRHRFFELWTLKEAYIKARGMGLAIPLGDFSFELAPRDAIGIQFQERLGDRKERWQFAVFRLSSDHLLSVARGATSGQPLEGGLALSVHKVLPLLSSPESLDLERLR